MTGIGSCKKEVGILKSARMHEHSPNKCFLIAEHEKLTYMGCLIFDDMKFCAQIHDLLQFNVGRSIAEIGSIDLSQTL